MLEEQQKQVSENFSKMYSAMDDMLSHAAKIFETLAGTKGYVTREDLENNRHLLK